MNSFFLKTTVVLSLLLLATQWLTAQNCQTIQAQVFANSTVSDSNFIGACRNSPMTFTVKGIYPQNDTRYHQSDSTAVISWNIDHTIFQGNRAIFTFPAAGTYKLTVTIKDTAGCTGSTTRLVRVSAKPLFRVKAPVLLALGDSIVLKGGVNRTDSLYHISASEQTIITNLNALTMAQKQFIPDDPTQIFESSAIVTSYPAGQTLQSVTDFFAQINMEHSWARDLEIKLICPNGRNVILHKYDVPTRNINQLYLGTPNLTDGRIIEQLNDPIFNPSGVGASYKWTATATSILRTALGQTAGIKQVPAGDYKPETAFTALIGCPLNGEWKISIKDNFAKDNGWIFYWKLNLPALNQDTFKAKITNYRWLADAGVQQNFGDSILIKPRNLSDTLYRFEVKDTFGCVTRTAYGIKVVPQNHGLLSGELFKSYNLNCLKDNLTQNLAGKVLKIFNATDTIYTAANSAGRYELPLKAGAYRVVTDTLTNTKFCADTAFNINIASAQALTASFGFQPKVLVKDVAVSIGSAGAIRPGFGQNLYVIVHNQGTYTSNSTVSLTLDTMLTPITNMGLWNPTTRILQLPAITLLPGYTKVVTISTAISRFVPIRTPVNCSAYIPKEDIETDTLDNSAILTTVVTGAYDPNDKTVSPQGNVPYGTTAFDYTIRFQNTGNDTAFRVVVKDTLPSQLDPLSISTLGSSHPYRFNLEQKGIATWVFDPIFLQDSFKNEPESHGIIRFSIQSKGLLPAGTTFSNRVGIYFDYNDGILTPYAPTTIIKKKVQKDTLIVSLCLGDTYKNILYTQNTFFIDTVKGNNIDTITPVKVFVNPKTFTTITTSLLSGEVFGGIAYYRDTIIIKKLKTVYGCDSTVTVKIFIRPTAVNDLPFAFSTLHIFPNPTSAYLSVEFELTKAIAIEWRVYNLLGQRIRLLNSKKNYGEGKHLHSFDIQDIPVGSYMIDIKADSRSYRQLFIKQ